MAKKTDKYIAYNPNNFNKRDAQENETSRFILRPHNSVWKKLKNKPARFVQAIKGVVLTQFSESVNNNFGEASGLFGAVAKLTAVAKGLISKFNKINAGGVMTTGAGNTGMANAFIPQLFTGTNAKTYTLPIFFVAETNYDDNVRNPAETLLWWAHSEEDQIKGGPTAMELHIFGGSWNRTFKYLELQSVIVNWTNFTGYNGYSSNNPSFAVATVTLLDPNQPSKKRFLQEIGK